MVYEPLAQFRGSRDYVHSTDLYEEIVRGADAAGLVFSGPIDLRIKAKITRRPRYHFVEEDANAGRSEEIAAQCRFQHKGMPWFALISEGSEPVVQRKPYDEGPAAHHGAIIGKVAELTGETGLRPIEAVTALAVLLHKQALPPPPGKRWMLGQLILERALEPRDATELRIAIDKVLGTTITRSSLAGHDGGFGVMTFILAEA